MNNVQIGNLNSNYRVLLVFHTATCYKIYRYFRFRVVNILRKQGHTSLVKPQEAHGLRRPENWNNLLINQQPLMLRSQSLVLPWQSSHSWLAEQWQVLHWFELLTLTLPVAARHHYDGIAVHEPDLRRCGHCSPGKSIRWHQMTSIALLRRRNVSIRFTRSHHTIMAGRTSSYDMVMIHGTIGYRLPWRWRWLMTRIASICGCNMTWWFSRSHHTIMAGRTRSYDMSMIHSIIGYRFPWLGRCLVTRVASICCWNMTIGPLVTERTSP